MTTTTGNPGSFEATRGGCTCDPFTNQFGAGTQKRAPAEPSFAIEPTCRVHGRGSGWTWEPARQDQGSEGAA